MLKKIFTLPLALIPSMVLIIFLIFLATFLKIDVIECRIKEKNCDSKIYEKLESIKGKSLFFVNLNEMLNSDEFNTEIITLKSYQKKFPGTLELNFSEEKLLYQLNLKEEHLLISENGNILQNNQGNKDIIQVNYTPKSTNHSKIAKIIEVAKKNNLQITTITWNSDEEILLEIKNKPTIIIDKEAIDNKISMLGLLLNSKEIKNYKQPIREIDLRFNLPVLRISQ